MRLLRHLVLPVTLLTFAVGCGDDGEGGGGGLTAEEQAYVDEALEGFDPEEEAPLTEDDARCVATSMVEGVGVERLEEVGLTPESFSSDEDLPDGLAVEDAQTIVDGMKGCIDLQELMLAGIAEDASLSEETQECLAEHFDDDLVERSMVALLSEGTDALSEQSGVGAELMAAFVACPGALG
jgi:hypothetical protein